MFKLTLENNSYCCEPGQTVLDTLLQNNIDIAYGCRQGACHSCQIRSLDIAPPSEAQNGLKDTLVKQNYFLACSCYPEQDMTIKLSNHANFSTGTVVGHNMLNRNTLQLIIECPQITEFYAGQFVNLQRDDGLTRSYSIANIPQQNNTLEFHISRLPDGRFSQWAHDELQTGDTLKVSEPQGNCFYLPERKQKNMLLVGTGSGLAPLAGILTDALAHDHSGSIHLFHGSREAEDLYKVDEMRKLAEQQHNFHYTACVSGSQVPEGFASGRVNDVALANFDSLSGWTVYLCGHPEMVEQMKIATFLKGTATGDIYSDAFLIDRSGTN